MTGRGSVSLLAAVWGCVLLPPICLCGSVLLGLLRFWRRAIHRCRARPLCDVAQCMMVVPTPPMLSASKGHGACRVMQASACVVWRQTLTPKFEH